MLRPGLLNHTLILLMVALLAQSGILSASMRPTHAANVSLPAFSPPATFHLGEPSGVPTCALYTVAQQPGHRSQLLALDLRNRLSYPLGELAESEIRGLAVHPQTGVLYAVTDMGGNQPGLLYRVDRATGMLTPLGPHGFESITALALRWTDATLWGWAEGAGLVQLDTATGAGSLRFASSDKFSGLAWANDGSTLYASQETSLWSYREGDPALHRVADNLPRGTSAIEMRADGLLVGIARKDEPGSSGDNDTHPLDQAWVFIYNPTTRQLVSEDAVPTPRHYPGFAGLAWPRACGNPSPGGPADIIQSITLDKTQVCPGESVLVTAKVAHPESPQGVVDVTINGRWGSPQYLQFTGTPGPRLIVVSAATPEKFSDMQEVSVEVVDCGPDPEFLEVTVRPNPFHAYTVDFEIANAAVFSDQDPTYMWDFGDGQTLQTGVPYAPHSYAEVMAQDRLYSNFEATITLQRSGLPDLTARKTVTLWNNYAYSKQQGTIQPPVESDERLGQSGSHLTADYSITNLEDEAIQFTLRRMTYQPCDPDGDSISLPVESIQLEVPGRQGVTQKLDIPADQISPDMCGVELSLSGQDQMSRPTYASAYFSIQPNPVMMEPVDDQALLQLLNQIAAQGLVDDPLHIGDEDLYRLAREGKITFPPTPTISNTQQVLQGRPSQFPPTPAISNTQQVLQGRPSQADSVLGQPCQPGDPPPRPGVSCQATGKWTIAPAHIANARKGDAILSTGCGLVGGLLRQLSPPQRYSHTGIMTRDYYEVTHSTASEERYKDNPVGFQDSGGFDEKVLRYGWPGVVTQSVDQAFNGAWRVDPSGKRYWQPDFHADPARCDGDVALVYPLVVKPPPGAPPSARERLRAAADIARTFDGIGHYRFYAYSNSSIAYSPAFDAPADAGWAAGTRPTVCSQFVWYSLKLAYIQLEGPTLEETDVALGAQLDSVTNDGLYLYTEEERRVAAYWLYGQLHNLAYAKAGWLGDVLTDAADHFSNQFANCFVNDDCSSDNDSEAWRNPGQGRAVSPDNMLFWDGPATGGVYGYSEPLVYRGGEYVAETTWQPSQGVGTIAGRVLHRGDAVPDASVTIAGLELFTDANGYFRDDLIPAGTYEIVASKLIGGYYMSARQQVTINPGETTTVELSLQPPPAYIRRVVIDGEMFILDDEDWPFDDETETVPFYEARTLDVFQRDALVEIAHCVGDEVRVELKFNLHLKEEDNMTVAVYPVYVYADGKTAHAWLYEGTDCDTDDLEAWGWWYPEGNPQGVPEVPAGVTNHFPRLHLENNEFLSPDYADIELWVSNEQQTFPTDMGPGILIGEPQTAPASFESAYAPVLVHNFNDLTDANGLGGSTWTAADGGAFITAEHDPEQRVGDTGYGLRITYNGATDTGRAAWGTDLVDVDASAYETLSFYIKGGSGGEIPNIYLLRGDQNRGYRDIEEYVEVTTEWQLVEIPLADFADIDLAQVRYLQFAFEGEEMGGVIYLDDITLTGDAASPNPAGDIFLPVIFKN